MKKLDPATDRVIIEQQINNIYDKYDNESIYYIKTYEWKRQPYTNVS